NHRGVLGGTHRIFVRQGHHRGAQAYPFGGLCGGTQKWPRGRKSDLICIDVVLGDRRGGKPGTSRLRSLFRGPAITLCCGALIEEPGKKSYAWHGVVLYVSNLVGSHHPRPAKIEQSNVTLGCGADRWQHAPVLG